MAQLLLSPIEALMLTTCLEASLAAVYAVTSEMLKHNTPEKEAATDDIKTIVEDAQEEGAAKSPEQELPAYCPTVCESPYSSGI
jgi:hypothetical protein